MSWLLRFFLYYAHWQKINKTIFLCVISPLIFMHTLCFATDNILDTAHRYYQNGEFVQAIEGYSRAINNGLKNGYLYYNLANAYFRNGNLGRAILSYRRALRFLPRMPELNYNLNFARKQVKSGFVEGLNIGVVKNLLSPVSFLSKREWRILSLSFFVLFWICFALEGLWRSKNLRLLTLTVGAFLVISMFVLFFTIEDRHGNLTLGLPFLKPSQGAAVITESSAKVYAGDAETFQVITTLPEGLEILVSENRGDWLQLELPDNRKGWVRVESLALI